MFLRHFFSEKDAGGRFFIFIFLPFVNEYDDPNMFCENLRLLISDAESREREQPTILASKQGKCDRIELIVHNVSMIFHIY